jgi:hypothetical protein
MTKRIYQRWPKPGDPDFNPESCYGHGRRFPSDVAPTVTRENYYCPQCRSWFAARSRVRTGLERLKHLLTLQAKLRTDLDILVT